MQEILLKIIYFERELSKSLKKGNFIFSFEPSSFQWTKLSKQKERGTSDQSLFRLKIPLFVMYYLNKFDDVV